MACRAINMLLVSQGLLRSPVDVVNNAASESAGDVMPVTQLGHRTGGARDVRLSSAVT